MRRTSVALNMIWIIPAAAAVAVMMASSRPTPAIDAKRLPAERRHVPDSTRIREQFFSEDFPRDAASVSLCGAAAASDGVKTGGLQIKTREKKQWGYAAIEFRDPVNFFDNSLVFYARGRTGGETLAVGFSDTERRTTAVEEYTFISPAAETQKIVIRARDIKSVGIDKSKIARINFFAHIPGAGEHGEEIITVGEISVVPNIRP